MSVREPSIRPEKKFELSLLPLTLGVAIGSGFGFLFGLVQVIGSLYLSGFVSLFLSTVIVVAFFRVSHIASVRNASFYEESFEVKGKGVQREIGYAEVEGVTKVYQGLSSLFGPHVVIKLKGNPMPLILPYNPRNRNLKEDLFTWLLEKTGKAST